jgi:cell surface protein SprA
MRMYLTGFEDSVVLRFATMDLVRNQWRTFTYEVDTAGAYTPLPTGSPTTINVLAVNVEENSNRQPIPYRIPPGIERVQELSNNGVNLLQNEQAMSLQINNLEKHDSRAVFKTLNLDLREYGKLDMFIHAESGLKQSPQLQNGQVAAIIRIGQDFLDNYYEVKIPLQITQFNIAATAEQIWPDSNNLNLILNDLIQLKIRRDGKTSNIAGYYSELIGNRTYALKGNPNLGEVQGILIAIENETTNTISTEVWVNELRLSQINDHGGHAALARVDMQLADLGTLSVSANTYSYGFGSIDQQINQRAKNDMSQFDAALNIDAGKLLPHKMGVTIPVYASINKTILTPEYDPYDLDILYTDKLKLAGNKSDSVKKAAADITTIKTINFTNVRFGQNGSKPRLWSISNFDFSYSYTEFDETNPLILFNNVKKYRGGFGYTYNASSKFKEPFKNLIKNKSAWLAPIKDINYNFIPSLISFRTDINRQYGIFVPRIVNTYDSKVEQVDTTYDKFFTFDRYYDLRWDLTRSLNLDFSATAFATVDEPYGQLNTKEKKDSVRQNFFHAGRNTLYQQHGTLSYNIPLAKIPALDWITARYSYMTSYNWIGASLLAVNLGNTIENTQQNNLTGEFDFTHLYSKSKFLNAVNQASSGEENQNGNTNANPNSTIQPPKPKSQVIRDSAGNKLKGFEKRHALQKWRQQKRDYRKQQRQNKEEGAMNGAEKIAGQLLTMVKHASVSYNTNYDSRVPGITTGTGVLGQNQATNQPGFGYIFGKQPDTTWLNQKAKEGVITRDSLFNLLYTQDYQQQINLTAQVEPIREFNVDVNIQKTFSKNYSELYKNLSPIPEVDSFQHLNPMAGGGFSVSYISFQTLFRKSDPNQISQTFQEFQNSRIIIANRLAKANKYWIDSGSKRTVDGFPLGYGRYQQDVLLPAFIAAYTGKDPNTVSLINESGSGIKSNPFSGIHALPNWRLTYTGLTRIPALSDIFSNITITHGYNSTFSQNSFTSALLYYDPLHLGQPAFLDTVSGNYIPFYLIPNLTIQEQFAPLIGFDITTTDQTSLRFEYAKSRQLSLSLYDYQLSEVRSSSVTFGGTYRRKGVDMPFKLPFIKAKPGQTDLNVTLDLSLRNDLQTNSRLDQPTAYSTGGQKTISIQPSFDYLINNRIDLKFYFDQQRIIPYISTSAPIINTRAGIELRISIAPTTPGQ